MVFIIIWNVAGEFVSPKNITVGSNSVVPPSDVDFGKQSTPSEPIDDLGNQWGHVLVPLGPFVDRTVILYGSEFSIFLLDEEEVSGVGAPRFSYGASFQMFLDEAVNLLDFFLVEG